MLNKAIPNKAIREKAVENKVTQEKIVQEKMMQKKMAQKVTQKKATQKTVTRKRATQKTVTRKNARKRRRRGRGDGIIEERLVIIHSILVSPQSPHITNNNTYLDATKLSPSRWVHRTAMFWKTARREERQGNLKICYNYLLRVGSFKEPGLPLLIKPVPVKKSGTISHLTFPLHDLW
jgi:hypothetical protein